MEREGLLRGDRDEGADLSLAADEWKSPGQIGHDSGAGSARSDRRAGGVGCGRVPKQGATMIFERERDADGFAGGARWMELPAGGGKTGGRRDAHSRVCAPSCSHGGFVGVQLASTDLFGGERLFGARRVFAFARWHIRSLLLRWPRKLRRTVERTWPLLFAGSGQLVFARIARPGRILGQWSAENVLAAHPGEGRRQQGFCAGEVAT